MCILASSLMILFAMAPDPRAFVLSGSFAFCVWMLAFVNPVIQALPISRKVSTTIHKDKFVQT